MIPYGMQQQDPAEHMSEGECLALNRPSHQYGPSRVCQHFLKVPYAGNHYTYRRRAFLSFLQDADDLCLLRFQ